MSNSKLPSKIMIVDNDEGVLNAVARGLEAYKIQVVTARNWENALYQYNHHKLDLSIVALELEGMPGTALIQKWREHEISSKRDTAMILSTGMQRKSGDEALLRELGDIFLITKPIQIAALLSALANALNMSNERRRVSEVSEKVIAPLLEQQRVDKAVQIAVETLDPLGERGLFTSAKVHIEGKKHDEAIRRLQTLIERDSTNMAYHNELGRVYLATGRLSEAQRAFEKADQIAPQNLSRLNDMAELYLQMKMPAKSIEKLREIIKLTPEDKDLKYGMYERIYSAGFVEEAQSFCRDTTTPKELVRHFNNRGVMYSKQSDHVNALDEYQKAVRYIPGSKELHRVLYNMAIAHINLKSVAHLQEAHRLLLECLRLEPNFAKAHEKLEITKRYAAPSEPLGK